MPYSLTKAGLVRLRLGASQTREAWSCDYDFDTREVRGLKNASEKIVEIVLLHSDLISGEELRKQSKCRILKSVCLIISLVAHMGEVQFSSDMFKK